MGFVVCYEEVEEEGDSLIMDGEGCRRGHMLMTALCHMGYMVKGHRFGQLKTIV